MRYQLIVKTSPAASEGDPTAQRSSAVVKDEQLAPDTKISVVMIAVSNRVLEVRIRHFGEQGQERLGPLGTCCLDAPGVIGVKDADRSGWDQLGQRIDVLLTTRTDQQ